MKKLIYITFVLMVVFCSAYYFNNRCIAFGYDNIVISKELLCAKVSISEQFQYETVIYTPLKELEGDAKKYVPISPPAPTLEVNNT